MGMSRWKASNPYNRRQETAIEEGQKGITRDPRNQKGPESGKRFDREYCKIETGKKKWKGWKEKSVDLRISELFNNVQNRAQDLILRSDSRDIGSNKVSRLQRVDDFFAQVYIGSLSKGKGVIPCW